MMMQRYLSLVLLTLGVALCAAYGGVLPQATKQRETLKIHQQQIQGQNLPDSSVLAKLKADFEATPPLSPKARLNEWLETALLPFGIGCLLIVMGALIARKAQVNEETQESGENQVIDFGQLLTKITEDVQCLIESVHALEDTQKDQLADVRDQIQNLQRGDLERLIEARAKVRAKYGITAFAELYGAISQGERRINRAWSALTDAHVVESAQALQGAQVSLLEAAEIFKQLS